MQKDEEEEEEEEEKEESVDYFMCPSFSTYSSAQLANIADQVTRDHLTSQNDNHIDVNDDDDNFEFFAFQREASDQVFFDGYKAPVFPIFNHDIATVSDITGGGDDGGRRSSEEVDSVTPELPMKNLLISDEDRRRDSPSSASRSEVDDGIPAGAYCVWTPKSVQSVQTSPNRCKKSNSTGSSASTSKRWKLLDLLRRSNSDGKNAFDFLKKEEVKSENSKEQHGTGTSNELTGKKVAGGGEGKLSARLSAQEALNVRNREKRIKENNKRRTYLPYKQQLIGFADPLSGMGRTFPPF